MRVLLIDDDPDIRLLAGFVLEAAGHRVTFAETGRAGIEAAGQQHDVILLDYRLGDMTGPEVLAALADLARVPPVVFLTGLDDEATAAELRTAGALDVIAKPFDPEALVGRIERALRGMR